MKSGSLMCAIVISAAAAGCSACSKGSQPATATVEAGTSAVSPTASHARVKPPAAPVAPIDHTPIWLRDSGTRYSLIQPLPMPSGLRDAGPPPPGLRQPDWDLSKDDPARDYARRYAFFTRRYPDGLDCVEFGPSEASSNVRRVTVTTAAACPTGGGAGTVRDVFLVDTAGDHLTVDDKTKRSPLAKWPDGSDPEGPASPQIREVGDMKNWKSPLQDALLKQQLAALRMQSYGRGTYPVVSIAGWHGVVQLDAPPDALQPLADALCAANDNMPMAIVAGFDRAHVLRITCPASTRWDKF